MKNSHHVLFFTITLLFNTTCAQNANWGLTDELLKYLSDIVKHASEESRDDIKIIQE
jgi:hypothetical protein